MRGIERKSRFFVGVLLMGCISLTAMTLAAQQSGAVQGGVPASGAVPNLIKYSGVLKDASGAVLTTLSGVTFLIYKDEQGGTPLWMETQNVQPDKAGRYTVQLGAVSKGGLPADVFMTGEARWLAVQIGNEAEQPRVTLAAVPYAMKAADAQTLGGLPASAFVLAAPSVGNAAASSAPSDSSTSTTAPPPSSSAVTTTGGTINALPMFTTATNIQNSILTQTGTTGINVAGALNLPAKGAATASAGFSSRPLDFVASVFNSTTSAPVAQTFQWQAEPVNNDKSTASGALNLLYAMGTATPAETGLKINSKGLFTFAAGQTFPGTGSGTVTSVGLSAPATDFTVTGSPVTSSGTLNFAWTVAPTSADTPNAIVKRDANGNFNAGSIVATALASTGAITGGTASANIISAGSKLGVGTAAPVVPLDVFSSTAGIHAPLARFGSSGAQDANSILVYNGIGNTEVFAVGGPSSFMPGTFLGDGGLRVLPGKNIFFGDSGQTRLELTPGGNAIIGGNVGVGTTAPAYPLQVIGTMRSETGLSLGGTATLSVDAPGVAGGQFLVSKGNVGIGTNAPTFPLHVQGTMRSETGLSLGGNAVLQVDAPGSTGGRLQVNNSGVSIGLDTPMNSSPHMSFSGAFFGSLCQTFSQCGGGNGTGWGGFVPDKNILITRITATITDLIDASCLPGSVGVYGYPDVSNWLAKAPLPAQTFFLDSPITPPAAIPAGTQLRVFAELDNPGSCKFGASAGGNIWVNVQYVMQ